MAADSTLHLDSLQDAATAASPKRYQQGDEKLTATKKKEWLERLY